jgi:hypothetical protein
MSGLQEMASWLELASRVLKSRGAFFGLPSERIEDVEIIPGTFDGPDRMNCHLIFATREEAAMAAAVASKYEQRVHALLTEFGFPSWAVPSFRVWFTSLPEIEEGGGSFNYFR